MAEILLCFVSFEDLEETAAGRKIMKLTPWEEDKERYRTIKTCLDFTPDTEAMKQSVAHLPTVSEERAALLMSGVKETTILEDAAALKDMCQSILSDEEERKDWNKRVDAMWEEIRARGRRRRGEV